MPNRDDTHRTPSHRGAGEADTYGIDDVDGEAFPADEGAPPPRIRARDELTPLGRLMSEGGANDRQPVEDYSEGATEGPGFRFDPLAVYKGALRRFFTVYRHVFGLLAGGLVAYVRSLPPTLKRGLRSPGRRLAALVVRPFLKRDLVHLPFSHQLRRRFEILGPTFIKLGQILAVRRDILPREVTDELENLLDRLPPISYEQVEAIIERDFGRSVEEAFQHLERQPLGSGSIAQVHRAVTRDGQQVVLKVIKPGIREVVSYDLKLLEAVGVFLEWLIPQYQPRQILEEFISYTSKEVDYSFEAENAELFAANFEDMPEVVFPRIYRELTSRNVLTMEYIQGIKPGSREAQALSKEERNRVIDLGAQAIIRMLYKDGFFHADLHPGNLLILPGDPVRIGFIDFGMVGRFGESFKRRLLYYYYSLVTDDIEGATRHLLEMAHFGEGADPQGFRRAVEDLSRRFIKPGYQTDYSIAQLILESLSLGGKHRVFFPVEMTLMCKALVTYEGVGRTLDPHLDIAEISRMHASMIFRDRFDPRVLSREMMRNAPEMVDLIIQMPHLLTAGARYLDDSLNNQQPENPLAGVRSGIIAAACIVGGVLGIVADGPLFLWVTLFVIGFLLSVFGSK